MFTLSFSLVSPSSELEDRPQTQVREHLDLGHNNNTHFLVNYAVAPAIFDAYARERITVIDFRVRALALAAPGAFQPLVLGHGELAVACPGARAAVFFIFSGK